MTQVIAAIGLIVLALGAFAAYREQKAREQRERQE